MYKNILVPIALDHEHQGEAAVALAGSLLEPNGTMTLLHVMDSLPAYVVSQLPEGLVEANRDAAAAELKQVASNAGGNTQVKVISGRAGRAISDYAEDHDFGCIVIASHRPGLQDYLIGSTAAFVVRHAPCAVHVMR